MVRARGSYPRSRGFKSPLRHIGTLIRRIPTWAAAAALLCASAAQGDDAALPRESIPPYEETVPSPEETPALPPTSPWDNITQLKKDVAAGALTAGDLYAVMEEGNAFGLYDRVAEVAEIALGTPAAIKTAAEAERTASLRAQERLPEKRPSRVTAEPLKFEPGITLYQGDARIWNEAGVAYLMLARGGDAREAFLAAIARDAFLADPHANLGLLYRKKGWYEQALSEYDLALERNGTDPTIWYNRAAVLLKLGRVEETFQALETSSRLDPKYRPPVRRQALLWFDLGDYKTAHLYALRLSLLLNADPAARDEEKKDAADLLALCDLRLSGSEPTTKETTGGTLPLKNAGAKTPPAEKPGGGKKRGR